MKMKIMKKAINLPLLIIFQFISLGSFAQKLTDQWRLIKETSRRIDQSPDGSTYKYDAKGRLIEVNELNSKKKAAMVSTDFVYNEKDLITSYKVIYKNVEEDYDYYLFTYTYDDEERVTSINEVHKKYAPYKEVKNFYLQKFTYSPGLITHTNERTSFGGRQRDSVLNYIDKNGNTTKEIVYYLSEDGSKIKKKEEQVFPPMGKTCPNPLFFTGSYFKTLFEDPQISLVESSIDTDKHFSDKYTYTFNKEGLLLTINNAKKDLRYGETFKFITTYTYIKIAPSTTK
jgi:YD repeat-containing protein